MKELEKDVVEEEVHSVDLPAIRVRILNYEPITQLKNLKANLFGKLEQCLILIQLEIFSISSLSFYWLQIYFILKLKQQVIVTPTVWTENVVKDSIWEESNSK